MDERFFSYVERNIGVLTGKEQMRLQHSTVAIAGSGGVGGFTAERLVRLGIGKLRVADPEAFALTDLNRQYGATAKTVGRPKVEVLRDWLTEINPSLAIDVFPQGVTPENADEFVKGADIVIDAIEFFNFRDRKSLYREARNRGITVILSGAVGLAAPLLVFTPESMPMEEYFQLDVEGNPRDFVGILQRLCPRLPGYVPVETALQMLRRDRPVSTLSPTCALAGALLSSEALLILLRRRPSVVVPRCIVVDLFDRKFVEVDISTGEGVTEVPVGMESLI